MLYALLLGLGFNFLSQEGKCAAGIQFTARPILRFGVALLGMRITFEQISDLGLVPLTIAVTGVALTILFGLIGAKFLKRGWRIGVLTGGAVAICGASAALAIVSVLPQNKNTERNTLFTVIGVTALSTVAMVIYPIFTGFFGLSDRAAGIFIGATIHDVAQVVGAGYAISDEAGDTATFVKLIRVAMLIPVVGALTFVFRSKDIHGSPKPSRPWFLGGFALLVTLNSLVSVPAFAVEFVNDVSRWALMSAIAALGMKTSLSALFAVGREAVLLISTETLFLAAYVFTIVILWT